MHKTVVELNIRIVFWTLPEADKMFQLPPPETSRPKALASSSMALEASSTPHNGSLASGSLETLLSGELMSPASKHADQTVNKKKELV